MDFIKKIGCTNNFVSDCICKKSCRWQLISFSLHVSPIRAVVDSLQQIFLFVTSLTNLSRGLFIISKCHKKKIHRKNSKFFLVRYISKHSKWAIKMCINRTEKAIKCRVNHEFRLTGYFRTSFRSILLIIEIMNWGSVVVKCNDG